MKPLWSDVPEGYDWMAQDADGAWFAYTHEPTMPRSFDPRLQWLADSSVGQRWKKLNEYYAALIPNPNWRNTLEKRPDWGESILESTYGNMFVQKAIERASRQIHNAIMLPFPVHYDCNRFAKKLKGEFMCPGNCPLTKNLTPLEKIKGKKEQLTEQINRLDKRIANLDDIVTSVNWKNATAEIKNKAVQAADLV